MGAVRFKLRRVLIGVVAGLVALALAFYGWVQYRQSQYDGRERAMLSRYGVNYSLCLSAGTGNLTCVRRVLAACAQDGFWLGEKPFAMAGSPAPDVSGRCRAALARG